MFGICSFGGYVPQRRLNRMSVFQSMGWFNPALIMVAQGERSFCNWDEDSLTMAVAAAGDCLTGMKKEEVDAVFLASTTLPFADRSNAGILKTALNLRDDLLVLDVTATQKAGTSALLTALTAVRAGEHRRVLVAATDKRQTKAANFYELWFGDGAAALLVGDGEVIAEFLGSYSLTYDFVDHYRGSWRQTDYTWEERWVRDEGYSKILPATIGGLLRKLSLTIEDIDKLIFPCYFKAEHAKIAKKLGAAPAKVMDNMHEVCGETGVAHPLLMLAAALEEAKPGDRLLVAGFGQGGDALLFKVTDAIKTLPERIGIKGALADKRVEENYAKFLKFRELLPTDMGIRGEAPTQTALTTLWRRRQMVTGMVGGKCTKCGTPQYPLDEICVNPACLAYQSQEPYEFANLPAKVKSFTGDMLAVSIEPPAVYGLVEFEGGGRYFADFTDCELEKVRVGQPVKLSFRVKYVDRERGFTGYYWKAVPQNGGEAAEAACAGPTTADVFAAMKAAFKAEKAAGVDLVFQYKISGPDGGQWHVIVKDGACEYHEGLHEAPTCTLLAAAGDFLDISFGKLDAMVAFAAGKLKVEGDMMKVQMLGRLFGKLTPPAPPAPAGPGVEDVFRAMVAAFRPERAAGEDLVFQYRISGPGGGQWHVSVKDQQAAYHAGEHAKPTTILEAKDQDFLDISFGKLDAMVAFTSGKLKVSGDMMKVQMLGRLFGKLTPPNSGQ